MRVAVGVEDLAHALRLGDRGVSEGSAPEDVNEVMVRFDSTKAMQVMRVPLGMLVPEGKAMGNMK